MNPIVDVEIIEVRNSSVVVKLLGENRQGFISRRELTWERRKEYIPDLPVVGEKRKAAVIGEAESGRYIPLSFKQLTDPWQDADQRYQIGDVVRGEVVSIRDFGAFVQLEPGIDALVRPSDMPLHSSEGPKNALAVGDVLQATIIKTDWIKKHIDLSILAHFRTVSQALVDKKIPQTKMFQDAIDRLETEMEEISYSAEDLQPAVIRRYHPPLLKLERVLVIDDLEADQKKIQRIITSKWRQLDIRFAFNLQEALDYYQNDPEIDLVIIDLTLGDENGIDVGQALLSHQPGLALLFTSNDHLVDDDRFLLHGRRYPFALKEIGELDKTMEDLYGGYWDEKKVLDNGNERGNGNVVRQLGIKAFAQRPLDRVLHDFLSELRRKTGITYAMILEVDDILELVNLIAYDGPQINDVFDKLTEGLFLSPVRNVVEYNEKKYEPYADPQSDKLQYFFPLLPYRSYIGIPLAIPGMPPRHALFLLDEKRPTIKTDAQEHAQLISQFIQVALERGQLLDFMHRYAQRYVLGQLLGSLVHELNNKLDALGAIDTLAKMLKRAENSPDIDIQKNWLLKSRQKAEQIANSREDIKELVWSYSRLARGDFEAVDVNEVITKVTRQLAKRAQEAQTRIVISRSMHLPTAEAVLSRLEQVVTNLVLNAIQQIERHRRRLNEIAQEKGERPAYSVGAIRVQTRYLESATPRPIQIIITDSGPGIHEYLQEEIFLLDTSGRRQGQGLGLYISRGLMESMGGRLYLADSILYLGSAFVVTLPKFAGAGAS